VHTLLSFKTIIKRLLAASLGKISPQVMLYVIERNVEVYNY